MGFLLASLVNAVTGRPCCQDLCDKLSIRTKGGVLRDVALVALDELVGIDNRAWVKSARVSKSLNAGTVRKLTLDMKPPVEFRLEERHLKVGDDRVGRRGAPLQRG